MFRVKDRTLIYYSLLLQITNCDLDGHMCHKLSYHIVLYLYKIYKNVKVVNKNMKQIHV